MAALTLDLQESAAGCLQGPGARARDGLSAAKRGCSPLLCCPLPGARSAGWPPVPFPATPAQAPGRSPSPTGPSGTAVLQPQCLGRGRADGLSKAGAEPLSPPRWRGAFTSGGSPSGDSGSHRGPSL